MRESYPSKGEFRNLWILFLPLVGTTFSNYLFQLLEKLFLTRVSSEAMEAALNATYACQIFQMAALAAAMMTQVSVARWYSAQEWKMIGPGVWQFIWFSFLSMIVTVPGSILYGNWYFKGTEIELTALPYFYTFTAFNFIYPLTACLSCFFLGMGKIRLVLQLTLADQVVKIILCYFFVFGFEPYIQPQGLIGGALSNLFAQVLLCLIFATIFFNKKNREEFNTHKWKFQATLFWQNIQPGLYRALNRIFGYGSWAMVAHLMATKGGEYLLILSVGGSLANFFPFLFEAIYQAQTIIVSQLIGAKKITQLMSVAKSGIILVISIITLIGIPFIGFSSTMQEWLFPGLTLDHDSVRMLFFGVWLWFAYFTISAIPLSYIFAFKDTKFYFYVGIIFWFTDYYLMRLVVNHWQIDPKFFWLALSIVQMTNTIPLYFWRMRVLCKRALDVEQSLI
jgi:multidrug resistance protein, MATE family